MRGTVKWFDLSKGYGFIHPDAGNTDVFVHITEVVPFSGTEWRLG